MLVVMDVCHGRIWTASSIRPMVERDKQRDSLSANIFSPQVYPTGPGVHVASPHTLSVTPAIEHPANVGGKVVGRRGKTVV